jgi:predicted nucleic acid-binding protein
MKDDVFLDSSVLIYSIDKFPEKKEKAIHILENKPVISTQVINEISSVMNRKLHLSFSDIFEITRTIVENGRLVLIDYNTISLAYFISGSYKYSYYDSLIIASALENHCAFLYSEDMQNKQVIENRLKIINPFKE